jgi:hypothetical protein
MDRPRARVIDQPQAGAADEEEDDFGRTLAVGDFDGDGATISWWRAIRGPGRRRMPAPSSSSRHTDGPGRASSLRATRSTTAPRDGGRGRRSRLLDRDGD